MISITVEYGNYHKVLKFTFDGKEYDISSEVPERVWNIGQREYPIHPLLDWQTRKELRKIFIEYFKKNIDKNLNEDDVTF